MVRHAREGTRDQALRKSTWETTFKTVGDYKQWLKTYIQFQNAYFKGKNRFAVGSQPFGKCEALRQF